MISGAAERRRWAAAQRNHLLRTSVRSRANQCRVFEAHSNAFPPRRLHVCSHLAALSRAKRIWIIDYRQPSRSNNSFSAFQTLPQATFCAFSAWIDSMGRRPNKRVQPTPFRRARSGRFHVLSYAQGVPDLSSGAANAQALGAHHHSNRQPIRSTESYGKLH